MNQQPWSRRDFVKAAGLAAIPALVALPALANEAARPAVAPGTLADHPELWAEARSTIEFYQKHLPVDLRLGKLTSAAREDSEALTRVVSVPIIDGDSEVGSLVLDATFQADESRTLLWQSTKVAGAWYPASISNAFKAGITL